MPALASGDASSQRTLKSRKVLIVEDDHLVAMDVEAALLDAGYEITGIASSAEQAIKLAATEKPDLVVMDIRLAGQRDGVDAALELFHGSGIRSLFATAHQDITMRRRAKSARPLRVALETLPTTSFGQRRRTGIWRTRHAALATSELHQPWHTITVNSS